MRPARGRRPGASTPSRATASDPPGVASLGGYNRPGIERTFYDSKCVEVIDPFGNRIRFNERIPTPAAYHQKTYDMGESSIPGHKALQMAADLEDEIILERLGRNAKDSS